MVGNYVKGFCEKVSQGIQTYVEHDMVQHRAIHFALVACPFSWKYVVWYTFYDLHTVCTHRFFKLME